MIVLCGTARHATHDFHRHQFGRDNEAGGLRGYPPCAIRDPCVVKSKTSGGGPCGNTKDGIAVGHNLGIITGKKKWLHPVVEKFWKSLS
jgi:hypothetical protein